MKVVQVAKKLNNTELGKGGTHDTYVLIPNDLDVSDIFDEPNKPIEFIDKYTKEKVKIRNTVGREKRLVGLGQYYRSRNLYAGDEIVFEKQSLSEKNKYLIYTQKYENNLVLQKSKYGFEILTMDRYKEFKDKLVAVHNKEVIIEYLQSKRKRNDSPDETEFYDVKIDGESLFKKYKVKDLIEIRLEDNSVSVLSFYGWKKYTFELEG